MQHRDSNPYRPPDAVQSKAQRSMRDRLTGAVVAFLPTYFLMSLMQAMFVDQALRAHGWLRMAVSVATLAVSTGIAYWITGDGRPATES